MRECVWFSELLQARMSSFPLSSHETSSNGQPSPIRASIPAELSLPTSRRFTFTILVGQKTQQNSQDWVDLHTCCTKEFASILNSAENDSVTSFTF